MQHIHQEEPIQYHVIKWRNSAFHNHGLEKRRKLLGGVYLDGGGSASGSGKGSSVSQAGVHTAQPSFPDSIGNSTAVGIGTGALKGITGTNQKANQTGKTASAGKPNNVKKTDDIKMSDVIKSATDSVNTVIQQDLTGENNNETEKISSVIISAPTDNRMSAVFSKYISKLRGYMKSFMQGMGQKADSRSSHDPKKQNMKGTRAITKEEVYEIQVNTAYLLDSYNKYGERSTLGK